MATKREKKESVKMTAEEKELFNVFKENQAKKAAQEKAKADRELYRDMVNDEVLRVIPLLREVSAKLTAAKRKVFDDFKSILEMKSDVMKLTKDSQQTHTFTDREAQYRLILGVYMLDGYDDTVESGVKIVKEYIASLAGDDPKTRNLVGMVLKLLAKDSLGNLKASRVLQLRKLADESGDERFVEGVRIIEESYRPTQSKTFIRAEERAINGGWKSIPLGMTEA